jgi:hypothetical protein
VSPARRFVEKLVQPRHVASVVPERMTTIVLIAIAATLSLSAARPETLTVRLYNTAGIADEELQAARRAAELILGDTGVHVVFRQCLGRVPSAARVESCSEPLEATEVVVRVIDAPTFNTRLHPDAYGITYVIRDVDRGWLATVFSDRIHAAAARVDVDSGTLLGRVMAHEVGHLLLGNGYHGDDGVMRGEWSDELLARKGGEWRFTRIEAARMQRVLAAIASGVPSPL